MLKKKFCCRSGGLLVYIVWVFFLTQLFSSALFSSSPLRHVHPIYIHVVVLLFLLLLNRFSSNLLFFFLLVSSSSLFGRVSLWGLQFIADVLHVKTLMSSESKLSWFFILRDFHYLAQERNSIPTTLISSSWLHRRGPGAFFNASIIRVRQSKRSTKKNNTEFSHPMPCKRHIGSDETFKSCGKKKHRAATTTTTTKNGQQRKKLCVKIFISRAISGHSLKPFFSLASRRMLNENICFLVASLLLIWVDISRRASRHRSIALNTYRK